MNLYSWESATLSDYTNGLIIVIAESVDEAREKVIAEVRHQYSRLSDLDREVKVLHYQRDMLPEPKTSDVIFIFGRC